MSEEIRWKSLTHQEIFDRVWAGPGHLASAEAQTVWREVGSRLAAVVDDLNSAIDPLRADWEGPAASAVARNLAQLNGSLSQAAHGAQRLAGSLDLQAEHVATLRNTLPPPPPPDPLTNYPGIEFGPDAGVAAGLLEDQQQLDAQRAELAQQAVQAMETYTTNSARNKAHMYAFASPLPVTNDAVAASSFSPTGLGPGVVGGFGGGLPNPVTALPAALPPLPGAGDALPVGQPGSGFGGGAGVGGGAGGGGVGGGAGGVGGGVAVPFVPGAGVVGGASGGTATPGGRGGGGVRPGLNPSAGNRQTPSFRVPQAGTVSGARGGFPGLPGTGVGPGLSEPGVPPRGTSGVLPSGTGTGTGAGTVNGARPAGTHGFFPPGGGAAGGQSREHRRPPYLIDDTDAFGDDRYFTPQVITPDDYIPRRT